MAYRITINHSRNKRYLLGLLWVLLISSIFAWNPDTIEFQLLIQVCLLLAITGCFIKPILRTESTQTIHLDEAGEISFLFPEQGNRLQIASRSLGTPWWIWLYLDDPILQERYRMMVFKDSVSDVSWRHLCRITNNLTVRKFPR